jgi:hypothetical protein
MTDHRHRQIRRHDMQIKLITTVVLASVITSAASAGPLENAWYRQKLSIANGIADGSLSYREAIRLERRAIAIRNEAAYLRATGGHLGPFERAYLGARLLEQRGAIYYHRHN